MPVQLEIFEAPETVPEEQTVTIWSRMPKSQIWVIERSYAWHYVKVGFKVKKLKEETNFGGRIYAAFMAGINPNN